MTGTTKIYTLKGKLFRYNEKTCIVEYIMKADAETIAEEAEWKEKHGGRPLFGIDADGYMVLRSAGLSRENWNNRETRDEYLSEWCFDLDEELESMEADFVKNELPALVGG